MTNKSYSSVMDMLRDSGIDQDLIDSTEQTINDHKLIRELMARRAARGMSQAAIAEVMACSQSRVSKLENAKDHDVRLGDLVEYANALDCDLLTCAVERDLTDANKVKMQVFQIQKNLESLLQFAEGDEQIADDVSQFLLEAFMNLTMIVAQCAGKLPRKSDGTRSCEIHIQPRYMLPEHCEQTENEGTARDEFAV